MLLLVIGSCSTSETDEASVESQPTYPMTLIIGAPNFEQMTRTSLPSGFESYASLYPQAAVSLSTIRTFMTTSSDADKGGVFVYRGYDRWSSNIPVTKGTQYYVYGFMPKNIADNVAISPNHGSYENGATLTITSLDAVTPADVCIIVGVESTNSMGTSGTPELGKFSYVGKEEDNYAYILLDHLYAGLHFRMKVNEVYNNLRTIKLKKLVLKANIESSTVNATINLWSKNYASQQTDYDEELYDPIEQAIFTTNSSTGHYAEAQLYPIDGEEPLSLTTTYQDFLGCFAPGTCQSYTLYSTYDVYDKKGNLVRADQTASNKIEFGNELPRGKINRYNLTVNPTYLYVLSDPDLDNPSVVIE